MAEVFNKGAKASVARDNKVEAERDPEGFEASEKSELGENSYWAQNLSLTKKRMVFVYKKQFENIRAYGQMCL